MNYEVVGLLILLTATVSGCRGHKQAQNATPGTPAIADPGWLFREPVRCGEVSGRVLDARTGAPLSGAFVTFDSSRTGAMTDGLGRFHLGFLRGGSGAGESRQQPVLRIRRIGMFEMKVGLPEGRGYTIEASIAPRQMHVDNISTLRIREPSSCVDE
jgi:hypothetical protein